MFGVKLSRTAEHLFKLAKKKYHKVARFTRFNASIKATDDFVMNIFGFMHILNEKFNLHLTITLEKGGVIYLR